MRNKGLHGHIVFDGVGITRWLVLLLRELTCLFVLNDPHISGSWLEWVNLLLVFSVSVL